MKPSVYVETTIVSYLVAGPTKDVVQAAHQRVTRDWWAARDRFDLFVSAAVIAEARRGDSAAATRRLGALSGIPQLSAGRQVGVLVQSLLSARALPARARPEELMEPKP